MRLAFLTVIPAALLTFVGTSNAALHLEPPAQSAPATPIVRTPSEYNLADGLAIQGYDPVAYFAEGGGKATEGKSSLSFTYEGVTYRFANQANLDKFKANPERYEPAHGGWCTYAMGAKGEKVEVDPKSFVIKEGRLFLFYKDFFNDTRAEFKSDQANLTKKADTSWQRIAREQPRNAPTK